MTHHMYLCTADATAQIFAQDTLVCSWLSGQLVAVIDIEGIGTCPVFLGDVTGFYDDPVRMAPADTSFPTSAVIYNIVTTGMAAYFLLYNGETGSTESWSVTALGVVARDAGFATDYPAGRWMQHQVDIQEETDPRIRAVLTAGGQFGHLATVQLTSVVNAVHAENADWRFATVFHGIIEADSTAVVPDQPDPTTPDPVTLTRDATVSATNPGHAGVFKYDGLDPYPLFTEWQYVKFFITDEVGVFPFSLWGYDATFGVNPISLATSQMEDIDPGDTQTSFISSCFYHEFFNGYDGNDHLYWNYIDPGGTGTEPTYGGGPSIGSALAHLRWDHQPDDIAPPHLFPLSYYTFSGEADAPETSTFNPEPEGPITGAELKVAGWLQVSEGRITGVPAPIRFLGGEGGAIGSVAIHFYPDTPIVPTDITAGPIEIRTRYVQP